MKKKKIKDNSTEEPKVHEELKGFNITIDKFGALSSNIRIDELNKFLDANVEDHRLSERKEEEE